MRVTLLEGNINNILESDAVNISNIDNFLRSAFGAFACWERMSPVRRRLIKDFDKSKKKRVYKMHKDTRITSLVHPAFSIRWVLPAHHLVPTSDYRATRVIAEYFVTGTRLVDTVESLFYNGDQLLEQFGLGISKVIFYAPGKVQEGRAYAESDFRHPAYSLNMLISKNNLFEKEVIRGKIRNIHKLWYESDKKSFKNFDATYLPEFFAKQILGSKSFYLGAWEDMVRLRNRSRNPRIIVLKKCLRTILAAINRLNLESKNNAQLSIDKVKGDTDE